MNRDKLIIIALAVIVAAVVVIVVPTIWSRAETDEPQPTAQDAPSFDERHYESIALEAATIMTTWHPASDHNRTDAELRARHLMTDERANKMGSPERPATGQEWITATQHGATSEPRVMMNYHTDSQEGVISVRATWDWVTENGETLASSKEERIYYFALNDQGEIHDYTYETIRAAPTETTGQ